MNQQIMTAKVIPVMIPPKMGFQMPQFTFRFVKGFPIVKDAGPKLPHPVQQCSECLKFGSKCKDHIQDTAKKKDFMCKLCGKWFQTTGALQRHCCLHTEDDPSSCEFCSKSSFFCDKCEKGFASSAEFVAHNNLLHTKQEVFECGVCKMRFEDALSCERHLKTHEVREKTELTNQKEVAGVKGTRRSQLKRKQISCSFCSEAFLSLAALEFHIDKAHQNKHLCGECGASYSRFSDYKKHCITHTKGKGKKCKNCGETFLTSKNRLTHNCSKSLIPPCLLCKKVYSNVRSLTSHLKSHIYAKPYYCSECGKTFSSHISAEQHTELYCFARNSVNIADDTAKVSNRCSECGECFNDAQNLMLHLYLHLHDLV